MLMEKMNMPNPSSQINHETIIQYENQIAELRKTIQILETAGAQNVGDKGSQDLEYLVYHRFNKNLNARLQFISRIIDWKEFSDGILNPGS